MSASLGTSYRCKHQALGQTTKTRHQWTLFTRTSLQLAKQLDSWGDTLRVIVTEVVDSVFGFLPSQVLWESEQTNEFCWLVSPRAQTGCSIKCACTGTTILECSSFACAVYIINALEPLSATIWCLQELPFHTALLTINGWIACTLLLLCRQLCNGRITCSRGGGERSELTCLYNIIIINYSCPSVSNRRSAEMDLTSRHKMLYLWLLSFRS